MGSHPISIRGRNNAILLGCSWVSGCFLRYACYSLSESRGLHWGEYRLIVSFIKDETIVVQDGEVWRWFISNRRIIGEGHRHSLWYRSTNVLMFLIFLLTLRFPGAFCSACRRTGLDHVPLYSNPLPPQHHGLIWRAYWMLVYIDWHFCESPGSIAWMFILDIIHSYCWILRKYR